MTDIVGSDPVPAVTEKEVTGSTARIFSEIRETLAVDVVNLVWRHLATMPGALEWVWDSLKPLYRGPAIAAAETARLPGPAIIAPGGAFLFLRADACARPKDPPRTSLCAITFGMKKPVDRPIEHVCKACNGTGVELAKQAQRPGVRVYPPRCAECLGKGRVADPGVNR